MTQKNLLLKKALVTLGIIAAVRLMYFIPLPGIRIDAVFALYEEHVRRQGGGLFDFMILLHAGRLRNVSLFAPGLMPLLNACVIVQVIGALVPGLQRFFYAGVRSRARLALATLAFAGAVSLIHGFFVGRELEAVHAVSGLRLLHMQGAAFYASAMVSRTAALMLLIIFAAIIDRFGLGNGTAVIFTSEALLRMLFALYQLGEFYTRRLIGTPQALAFAGIILLFIWFTARVTAGKKEFALKTHTMAEAALTIRPYWTGIWPLIITETFVFLFQPALNWTLFFTIAVLLVLSGLWYGSLVYRPRRFYDLIFTYQCTPELAAGKRVEDVFHGFVLRMLFSAGITFILLYYLPILVPLSLGISFISAGMFGAFGIITAVGLYYNIRYEIAFWEKLRRSGISRWSELTKAPDEPEAEAMSACLRSYGIAAAAKPSHFIWGAPVRTIISSYPVFVPESEKVRAGQILRRLRDARRGQAI